MSYLLVGKRAKEMAAAAEKKGLTFWPEDDQGLSKIPFSLMRQGVGHKAENIMGGKLRGHKVRGFDYPYFMGSGGVRPGLPDTAPFFRYDDGHQYGCVVLWHDADLPFVHISPRGGRKPQMDATAEVAVPDKQFRKGFQIWTPAVRYAVELLHPDVVNVIVSTKGQFSFEVHHDMIMCFARTVKPDEFPALMGLLVALVDRLPAGLTDAWISEEPLPGPEEETNAAQLPGSPAAAGAGGAGFGLPLVGGGGAGPASPFETAMPATSSPFAPPPPVGSEVAAAFTAGSDQGLPPRAAAAGVPPQEAGAGDLDDGSFSGITIPTSTSPFSPSAFPHVPTAAPTETKPGAPAGPDKAPAPSAARTPAARTAPPPAAPPPTGQPPREGPIPVIALDVGDDDDRAPTDATATTAATATPTADTGDAASALAEGRRPDGPVDDWYVPATRDTFDSIADRIDELYAKGLLTDGEHVFLLTKLEQEVLTNDPPPA